MTCLHFLPLYTNKAEIAWIWNIFILKCNLVFWPMSYLILLCGRSFDPYFKPEEGDQVVLAPLFSGSCHPSLNTESGFMQCGWHAEFSRTPDCDTIYKHSNPATFPAWFLMVPVMQLTPMFVYVGGATVLFECRSYLCDTNMSTDGTENQVCSPIHCF